MFKFKKAQQAIEFMAILTFVMVIIAGVMYVTGSLLVDFDNQEKENTANNFIENIEKEIEILNKVNYGYARELEIESKNYHVNVTPEFNLIIITDLNDNNKTYYYDIPHDLNITFIDGGVGNYTLHFEKFNQSDVNNEYLLSIDILEYDSCDYGGGELLHGESQLFFEHATVPYGNSCNTVSETRTCNNGFLSGSYLFDSCSVSAAADCSLGVNHGTSALFYQSSSVPYGSSCVSETRNCYDGFLSGSYLFSSCSVSAAADCSLPWGGSLSHGNSVPAYLSSSVPFGSSCSTQSRTCNDGTLSGSYQFGSCTVQGQDITPNAFSFTNQNNVNLNTLTYSNTLTPTGYDGPLSVSISGSGTPRLSINGGSYVTTGSMNPGDTLRVRLTSSSSTLTIHSSTITLGSYSTVWDVITRGYLSCSLPWGGNINHGSSVPAYLSSSVSCGNSCSSQTRTCNDGVLSGSYLHSSCSVQSCPTWVYKQTVSVTNGNAFILASGCAMGCYAGGSSVGVQYNYNLVCQGENQLECINGNSRYVRTESVGGTPIGITCAPNQYSACGIMTTHNYQIYHWE